MSNSDKTAETHADPHFDHSDGAAELRGEVYRPPEYLEYLEKAVVALKTVRLLVYAGMTSFVILAFYGFVLVYRLTTDVHTMVEQTQVMTQQMQAMARSMANMNQNIATMGDDLTTMTSSMDNVEGRMTEVIGEMRQMTESMVLMEHSARNMDRNISPMMGTMNRFMPFWPGSYTPPPRYRKPD
ncbi:MAG: hypothetical protein ACWA5A_06165 [Marinibacterium sp.]